MPVTVQLTLHGTVNVPGAMHSPSVLVFIRNSQGPLPSSLLLYLTITYVAQGLGLTPSHMGLAS